MTENRHTLQELKQWQALPLNVKIRMTETRIRGWIHEFGEDGVYISFSGGKDSTVLMDIVRNRMGYNIPAVFVDVPTQYPELKQFAQTWGNVEVLKPRINFLQVCERYGFPLFSKEIAHRMNDWNSMKDKGKRSYVEDLFEGKHITKSGKYSMISMKKYAYLKDAPFRISHKCCNVMKKEPAHHYARRTGRQPITAQMAEESNLRKQAWIRYGCNAFGGNHPISNPMSFWTEQDVLQYIFDNRLPICSVYGEVIQDWEATDDVEGQMTISDLKGFEADTAFDAERPKFKTTGCNRTGCMLCGFGCHLEKPEDSRFLRLKKTHPKMYALLDVMKNNGVTMREAIEWVNEHGNLNIRI